MLAGLSRVGNHMTSVNQQNERAEAPQGSPRPLPPVRLRPLAARDLPTLWLLHSDPRTFELDTIGPLTVVDQMERVAAQWIASAEADGFGYQLVLSPTEDSSGGNSTPNARPVLGVAGLSRMHLGDRWVANTYVRMFPEAWGRGYAESALTMCLRAFAFQTQRPGYPPLPTEAAFVTAEHNAPARRLAEKLGFELSSEQDPTESGTHVVYLKTVRDGAA